MVWSSPPWSPSRQPGWDCCFHAATGYLFGRPEEPLAAFEARVPARD